jgi:hypothetical protein
MRHMEIDGQIWRQSLQNVQKTEGIGTAGNADDYGFAGQDEVILLDGVPHTG